MTDREQASQFRRSSAETLVRDDAAGIDDVLARAIEEARRAERLHLAQVLHEGPAQVLASALYVVDLVAKTADRSPERLPEQIDRLRGLLKESLDEVRATLADLRKLS